MQPRKDYDDYSKFINDTFSDQRLDVLNKTIDVERNSGMEARDIYNKVTTLRTMSNLDNYKPTSFGNPTGFATTNNKMYQSH